MKRIALAGFLASIATAVCAQSVDIPLRNWTVPPYSRASSSGIHTMVDQTPPRAFIGLQVCRLLDTRPPANNPLDGDGAFTTDQIRTYTLPGACGIPSGTDAVSLNITVTNTASHPFGHIKIWPADQAEPNVSTLNWSAGAVTESNAAIVALSVSPAGQIKVKSGNAGSDVIIDTNGYFNETPVTANTLFVISTNAASPAIIGQNTAAGYGIQGISQSGYGVVASTGGSASNAAVYATNTSTAGGASGVYGSAIGSSFGTYGVFGVTDSPCCASAGVLGVGRGGRLATGIGFPWVPGVRGESRTGIGVHGLVETAAPDTTYGAKGSVHSAAGSELVSGVLGYSSFAGGNFGVVSDGPAHVAGVFTATTKSFVQPHPTDASKEIRYVSLEGPQSEIYFRGSAQISAGITRVTVPDYFRMVATPGSYSTLVTPVGGMATVTVLSEGEDGIVVQASRNVKIHYVVFAEREAVKQSNPIIENVHFRPDPQGHFLNNLPDSYRGILVANRTLNGDGTVNTETARRLGWDKGWEKRSRPAPQPAD